jgi:thiosulfate reductase cytochrome b subunit
MGISNPAKPLVYRHSAAVRITHWINAVCLIGLLLSGLQIFNAHPALYWGDISDFDSPLLAMRGERGDDGQPKGVTTVLGHAFDTTGVLGLSEDASGLRRRGFPSWLTLPSYHDLATGRRWHFFFAWAFVINGLIYLATIIISRRLTGQLLPSRRQLRHIGQSILDHARFRFDHGRDYNVLQKLSYLAVIFLLLPVMVLAGLAMSPGLDAAFPGLPAVFGGRQSARTVHFILAFGIVLFAAVHIFMVLVSGVWNNLRSMVTGYYAVSSAEPGDEK